MSLKEISENRAVAAQLETLLASGRLVHAFLFTGGSKAAREELGYAFADEILDRREDFIEVEKPEDKASIGTAVISELQKKLAFTPYGEGYVALIKDAELLTEEAQNKLLKTLEEPQNAVLILLAERSEAMLQTIRSRCTIYALNDSASDYSEDTLAAAGELLALLSSDGPYYGCKAVIENLLSVKEGQRGRALELLDALEEKCLEEIKNGNNSLLAVTQPLRDARRYIKQGHNVTYTLKQMCLNIQTRR